MNLHIVYYLLVCQVYQLLNKNLELGKNLNLKQMQRVQNIGSLKQKLLSLN